MFGFTYNLTDINTVTISEATIETAIEWRFTNLCEVKKELENQGYKVETNFKK